MERSLEIRLDQLVRRHAEVGQALAAAGLSGGEFTKLSKEYSELSPIVEGVETWRRALADLQAAAELANSSDDPDMRALAEEEIQELREQVPDLELRVKLSLLPKDED